MKSTSDGFKIADYDLKSRGPGDFFGTRQHGLPKLKIADMLEDTGTLTQCQECARLILHDDPRLDGFPVLCNQISNMFRRSNY